ncbi:MAG: toxin glutamine deamidase domain-containing protein [Kofleriaceae bacterium]
MLMLKGGEGTRGVVFGHLTGEPGHIFNAVVENGKVVYLDAGKVIQMGADGYDELSLFITKFGKR